MHKKLCYWFIFKTGHYFLSKYCSIYHLLTVMRQILFHDSTYYKDYISNRLDLVMLLWLVPSAGLYFCLFWNQTLEIEIFWLYKKYSWQNKLTHFSIMILYFSNSGKLCIEFITISMWYTNYLINRRVFYCEPTEHNRILSMSFSFYM